MPVAHPAEFRRCAVELARSGQAPIGQIAKDLGIADSCLRNWLRQDRVDRGEQEGLSSSDKQELAELRRRNRQQPRVLEMEVKILKRASAYFARENVLRIATSY